MNDLRCFVNPFPPSGKGYAFHAGLGPSPSSLPLVRSQSDHSRSLIEERQTISLEDPLGTVPSDRLTAQAVRAGSFFAVDAGSSDPYLVLVTLQALEIRPLLDYCIRNATNE